MVRRRHASSTLVLAGLGLAAALFATSPAVAAGVAPAQATKDQREQAQSHFLKGREKFGKGQFDAALVEFTASHDIVASPNTRLYVGRCQRELGKLTAAYIEFGRTEAEAKELARDDPKYEKAGEAAREERTKLEPLLGFITLDVSHSESTTTLKVGGEEIRQEQWKEPIPVMPGTAEIVVETPSRAPVRRTVDVAAAERKSVSIDAAESTRVATAPPPPPPPAKPAESNGLRTFVPVTGGVAIVGLAMFTFFGLKSNSTYSNLQSACNNGPCPPGHESDISDGRTQQTLANVGLAVFVVGAAATVTLWVLGRPDSKSAAPSAALAAGPSFVGLRGGF
jgi:hypothetical protein